MKTRIYAAPAVKGLSLISTCYYQEFHIKFLLLLISGGGWCSGKSCLLGKSENAGASSPLIRKDSVLWGASVNER